MENEVLNAIANYIEEKVSPTAYGHKGALTDTILCALKAVDTAGSSSEKIIDAVQSAAEGREPITVKYTELAGMMPIAFYRSPAASLPILARQAEGNDREAFYDYATANAENGLHALNEAVALAALLADACAGLPEEVLNAAIKRYVTDNPIYAELDLKKHAQDFKNFSGVDITAI